MSYEEGPITLFGVKLSEINVKPSVYSIALEDEPKYEDLENFVMKGVNDDLIGYAINDDDEFVGIFPIYPWAKGDCKPEVFQRLLSLDTKDKAAAYIAHALAPFCNSSEKEIANACDYIDTVWYA